jgi:hypothetical protein
MNRLITAIAIVITLSTVQSCTQSAQKEEIAMTATAHDSATHGERAGHIDKSEHLTNHATSHGEHGDDYRNTSVLTQLRLVETSLITSNAPTTLQVEVQDRYGNAIDQFDQFQEKMMHLIVVSDDLQVFQHIHPVYRGNGRFEVETQFPQSGGYTLFSDYQPTGQPEQVSVVKIQVAGNNPPAAQVNWNRTKIFADTLVNFAPVQATIRAREEVVLRFDLQDAASHQPIANLQPYLGEKGHLVILRQSPTLTRENYIHAHAVQNTSANQIHFATRFPQPGRYKLWGQFNRNGEIITADFWVEVL